MERLGELYRDHLQAGFYVLREAIESGDLEWAKAEFELLHNVPSLIEEDNIERHRYFWFAERELYLDRIAASGQRNATSRMKTYHEPIWRKMEPVMLELLNSTDQRQRVEAGT